MAAALDAGLREREWFVTGNIMPELFSNSFKFQDPDVKLEGVENYSRTPTIFPAACSIQRSALAAS